MKIDPQGIPTPGTSSWSPLFRWLVPLIFLTVWLFWVRTLLPDYLYGFDHYGYCANAYGQNHVGYGEGWGTDPLIPSLSRYLVDRGTVSTTTDFDLGFFLTPPAFFCSDWTTGRLINQYPPGFPLLLRPFLLGTSGSPPFLFNAGILAVWLLILIGSAPSGIRSPVTCGALLFLVSPVVVNNVIILTADILSTILLLTCLLIVLRSTSEKGSLFAAGCIGGFSILVRYPNLLIVGFVLLVLLFMPKQEDSWKNRIHQACSFAAGVIVCGIVPLASYLYALFGTPFQSTYLYYDPLRLDYIPRNIVLFLKSLIGSPFAILVLLLSCIGVVYAIRKRGKIRIQACVCLLYSGFVFLLYCCYSPENYDIRYVLPALALAMLAAGSGLGTLISRFGPRSLQNNAAFGLAAIIALFVVTLSDYESGDRIDFRLFDELKEQTPDNSVIFAAGWAGTLQYAAQRKTYRWMWAPREVVDAAVDFFCDQRIPLYVLIEFETPSAAELLAFLAERFVLEQRFICSGDTVLRLYKVAGRAADAGLLHGLVIPWGGSSVRVRNGFVLCDGPPLMNGFNFYTGSTGTSIRSDAFQCKAFWSGLDFSLMTDYSGDYGSSTLIIRYFDGSGDFIVQHWSGGELIKATEVHLTRTQLWRTTSIEITPIPGFQNRLQIQNDGDHDEISISGFSLTPEIETPLIIRYESLGKAQWLSGCEAFAGIPVDATCNVQPDQTSILLALDSKLPRVRAAALRTVLDSDSPELYSTVNDHLQELMSDPYFMVRALAVNVAGSAPDTSPYYQKLIALCDDTMAIVRRNAAQCLLSQNSSDERAVICLINDLSRDNYWEMKAAQSILDRFHIPYTLPELSPESM